MPSQWANSALLTALPSTVAIALPGMDELEPPPQPDAMTAIARTANRAMESRTALVIENSEGEGVVGRRSRAYGTARGGALTSRTPHGSERNPATGWLSGSLYAA